MTVGIYSITHRDSGKRYIGKSINVEARLATHNHHLTQPEFNKKACNRHLYNAVQKYGWEAFETQVLECFNEIDEDEIAARELFWMDHFNTCDRRHGYNLRRDSSTKMIVHEETRALHSMAITGEANPNFGNNWSDAQKAAMSEIQKSRHASGVFYGEGYRAKLSARSTQLWADSEKRKPMGAKVAIKKQKYDYLQFDRDGNFIRKWSSVQEIVEANPGFKWQNIYNVCHGHKPTYRGFVWKQVERATDNFDILLGEAA